MPIAMRDLNAKFIRKTDTGWRDAETIDEAQGVSFLCPKCFSANAGAVGTHTVICWSRSRGTPDDARPGPGRWTIQGTSIDDVHFEGDPIGNARSVQLNGGCGWHGFINHGHAEGDC